MRTKPWPMNRLGLLFQHHGSDKHFLGYHIQYEKHLPKEAQDFLEIGVWKGGGIKAFKDFYNGVGRFYSMNYVFGGEVISKEELTNLGITWIEGYQGDIGFLNSIGHQFNVIIDDGSHHSDDQMITFRHLFINNLKPGGVYIIEDLHCCKDAYWWRGVCNGFENTALAVMKKVRNKQGQFSSQFIGAEDNEIIYGMTQKVLVPNDSIAFIFKKNVNTVQGTV